MCLGELTDSDLPDITIAVDCDVKQQTKPKKCVSYDVSPCWLLLQHNLPPQPIGSKYTSDDDKLILEDELQRIILVGELKVQSSVTGKIQALDKGA